MYMHKNVYVINLEIFVENKSIILIKIKKSLYNIKEYLNRILRFEIPHL